MIATDTIHGASIRLGPGSKMIGLPPGVPVEQRITVTDPGEYLLYCSYYCGVGHQFMSGRIIVEPPHPSVSSTGTAAVRLGIGFDRDLRHSGVG